MTAQMSQGARFYIWNGAAPASHVTSAVTKAAPAVVSVVSATGIAVGDIVVPKGTGFRTIDEMPFRVGAVSTLDITLEDSDTSDEAGTAAAGTLEEYTLVEYCVAQFQQNNPAGTVIDVTTMCDVARKTRSGLPGQSTWTGNGFWDGSDAVQKICRDAYRSGDLQVFKLQFKDNSGITFRGTLDTFDMGAQVDQAVTLNVGGKVSGYVNGIIAS